MGSETVDEIVGDVCHHCGGPHWSPDCPELGHGGKLEHLGAKSQPLDLDALLAIVRKRTPGEWEVGGPYPGTSVIVCIDYGSIACDCPEPPMYEPIAILDQKTEGEPNQEDRDNARAIVSAVNALRPLIKRCKRAELELDEKDASFDLRWKADMRAIKRWRSESPEERELTWPDHADMVVWLLNQVAELTRQRDECLAALQSFVGYYEQSGMTDDDIADDDDEQFDGDEKFNVRHARKVISSVKGVADGA